MNVFAELKIGDRVETNPGSLFDDVEPISGVVTGFKERGLVVVETEGGIEWALHKLDLHRSGHTEVPQ